MNTMKMLRALLRRVESDQEAVELIALVLLMGLVAFVSWRMTYG